MLKLTQCPFRLYNVSVPTSIQKQRVDIYRKLLLRRKLLALAVDGAAYVPFIGDGDIALELYAGKHKIYGADLDAQRVTTAKSRLPDNSTIVVADCNGWPFTNEGAAFSVADFDSYSDPYASFRSFWNNASKADRLVLFFTDGHRQGIMRAGWYHSPDGNKEHVDNLARRRFIFNTYFPKFIKPWLIEYVKGWTISRVMFYTRHWMLYWGAVIERT